MTMTPEAPCQVGPIAVLCALDCELAQVQRLLPCGREEWHAERRVWVSALDGHTVVLALCGMGMMSAAAVAEAIIGHYRPSVVLNCGCTGAHRSDLLSGDLVVGARVVAYDSVRESADGITRYARMRYLHRDAQQKVEYLPAAPHLLESALRAAASLEGRHEPWPRALGWPESVPHRPPRVAVGTVASADRWNRSRVTIEALTAQHGSLCEDMEAAAIALTCASHDVPFLAVKDIANNELIQPTSSSADIADEAWLSQLGRRAAAFALEIMHDLIVRDLLARGGS